MEAIIIILFCIVAGLSLGAIAGLTMTMALSVDLTAGPYIGAIYGGMLGLLLSPLFILRRANKNIFAVLVLCFTLSFPVALIAGFTKILWVAVGLTMLSMLSVYYFSMKDGFVTEKKSHVRKRVFIVPLFCIIVSTIRNSLEKGFSL